MPVGSSAQAAAISRPRTPASVIAASGVEHAGQRGGAELADAVPGGHTPTSSSRQVLGRGDSAAATSSGWVWRCP